MNARLVLRPGGPFTRLLKVTYETSTNRCESCPNPAGTAGILEIITERWWPREELAVLARRRCRPTKRSSLHHYRKLPLPRHRSLRIPARRAHPASFNDQLADQTVTPKFVFRNCRFYLVPRLIRLKRKIHLRTKPASIVQAARSNCDESRRPLIGLPAGNSRAAFGAEAALVFAARRARCEMVAQLPLGQSEC